MSRATEWQLILYRDKEILKPINVNTTIKPQLLGYDQPRIGTLPGLRILPLCRNNVTPVYLQPYY